MHQGTGKMKTDHLHPRNSALTFVIRAPDSTVDPCSILPLVRTEALGLSGSHYLEQRNGAGRGRSVAGIHQ